MPLLDAEKFRAIDTDAVTRKEPFPFIHAEKLITDEGYETLRAALPPKDMFKPVFGRRRPGCTALGQGCIKLFCPFFQDCLIHTGKKHQYDYHRSRQHSSPQDESPFWIPLNFLNGTLRCWSRYQGQM